MLCARTAAGAVIKRCFSTSVVVTRPEDHKGTEEAAIYVHWPYCEKRCSYCNFNKYISRSDNEGALRSCLVKEAGTLLQLSQVRRITSVFFGGGTPSLASPSTIAAVLDEISCHALLERDAEITLEANPTSSERSRLHGFREAGVNRISVGLQSLDDKELHLLGRTHTASETLHTLHEARQLFPGRTSVDIIFGLPGQSLDSWQHSLQHLLTVCDDHLSLYQLTLERGTSLFRLVNEGLLPPPDPDLTAHMYDDARNTLSAAGFRHYEVSNFARNGALSTHNQSYWLGKQYIGVGPGAHGRFVPRGSGGVRREARIQTLEPEPWMREVTLYGHGTRKVTLLSDLDVLSETLVLGLRTDTGITHDHWQRVSNSMSLHHVFGSSEEIIELQQERLLLLDERGLRCSWKGLAVLDSLLLPLISQLQKVWNNQEQNENI
ncbi:radical S-adenosyl methionine domain-containing protein 1, mitochondrial [Bombina bombina]|uniref:radical S-adenosyl methionine domain-containing protein 1, mitochondrial n=1 Tax=Bombina bombina TaxID=8345 RepID=UPI00235A62CF|nr:radical S-adenosyl methionine domain-containing protein 1, mitochondrial [Bombina bombina]XP_053564794.1 radical S-adenosyl methionine domain-containing protein 1, mitochondrial [Bombina bombina]